MVNYKNSKVYELVCSQTGKKYIGSTCQKLCQRLAQHRAMSNKCSSKNLINPKIYLLTYVPCDSKEELHAIERLYIENNECINKEIPLRTKKEYYQDNQEHILEKSKKYRENNKEKVKATKKKYYQNNQEQISEKHKAYKQDNPEKVKAYSKKYTENHKEQIKEYQKQFYKDNKEQINQYQSQPIICECGATITKSCIARHRRSNFHQEYEELWN